MKEFTRESVSEWTKRQLGYPTVNVELTDEQLDDCIDSALEEIAPWVVQRKYVTLPVSERIDLSQYNVAYVINVHKTDSSTSGVEGSSIDPFSASYQFINLHDVSPEQGSTLSSTSWMHQYTNTRLEYQLSKQITQNFKDNISYRYIDPYLYLDIGVPTSSRVTIEYSNKILDLDDISDELYKRYVKRFTLAYAREILSDIRGKYEVSGSPVTLDGDNQDNKYSRDIDELRQELQDTVSTHFMVD